MDFNLDETQQEVYDLALRILSDRLDMERLKAVEAGGEWFDRETYAELAKSGLVGIALGEDVGGGGLDIVALTQVLRAQGVTVAPMPLLPTMIASLAIDRFGSTGQRSEILPGVADGSTILTVAVQESHNDQLAAPGATVADGRLNGTKTVVEFAEQASHAVVTATGPAGPGLYLVDLAASGISMIGGQSTRLDTVHEITFTDVAADQIGEGGVGWIIDHLTAALCMTQLGITEKALRLTADYTSEREQFGRPIATFQAVTQRLADQFINVEGIRLCSISATWRLSEALDASEDLAIAKWFASERATEIAHATQHCHGGMGVSVDYPLHRYTLWNKHLVTSLGAGTQQLRSLGAMLAAD